MRALVVLAIAGLLAGCAAPTTAPTTERTTLGEPWDRRLAASFEDLACPAPRPHDASRYAGRLVDGHIHVPHMPDAREDRDWGDPSTRAPIMGVDVTIDDIVCRFSYEGTDRAFGFFSVYPGAERPFVELARRTMERHPDAFVPFISPPDHDQATVDAPRLREMLAISPGLFRGLGELGLYAHPGDPDGMPPDAEPLLSIYPLLREQALVAYVHLGVDHQRAFETVLAANRDLTFVFHGDQLVTYGESGQDLAAIDAILSRHPNALYEVDELYGDVFLIRREVTRDEFLAHFADYEPLLEKDLATWKGLIERHPDQVLWGTDRGAEVLWSLDPEVGWTLNDYARAFIARLDPTVQEKYAYRNAERAFRGPTQT